MPETTLLALILAAPGRAADLDASLEGARKALVGRDAAAAVAEVIEAEEAAAASGSVLPARQVARMPYYRGLAEQIEGDPKHRAMEHWRNALVIDAGFPWDEAILADSAAQDVFEALRREVAQRAKLDLFVPEKTGAAKIFVDGQQRRAGDTVLEGLHLAQIVCPDGSVHGAWTPFRRDPKWLRMCPGGVDTAVVVAEESPVDDFDALGPSFPEPAPRPDLAAAPPAVEPEAATPEGEVARRKISWPLLAGAGGAAVLSGSLYALALKHRGDFDDLDNADLATPDDVDALRKKTNGEVYASAGLGVVATGLYVAAFVQW